MSKEGRRPRSTRRAPGAATYRGPLSVVALGTALLACAALVIFQRGAIGMAMRDLTSPHARFDVTTALHVARVLLFPLAAGVLAYTLADSAIRFLRIVIYMRSLHRYAGRMLQTQGALLRLGYQARVVRASADAARTADKGERACEFVAGLPKTLLVGEDGAGKSVVLWSAVYEATRRRQWPRVFVGAAPLPIMAPLAAYAVAQMDDDEDLMRFLVRQVGVFSTAGLAARLSARLSKRQALIVCDDLDQLDRRQLRAFLMSLRALDKSAKRPHRVAVTASERYYRAEPAVFAAVTGFEVAELQPINADEQTAMLRRVKSIATARPARTEVATWMATRRLTISLRTPATLAALAQVWTGRLPLPFGRAHLWEAWLSTTSAAPGTPGSVPAEEDALAHLASALTHGFSRSAPIPAGRSVGRAVAEWLAANPPLFPLERQASTVSELSPESIEMQCRAGLRAGVLTRVPDGASIQFANRYVQSAYAAHWLRSTDDGMGRLNSELLQEQWIIPLLLWSGAMPSPGDLATRLLRLSDTPDATAIRAGLDTREDVQPVALALAFAVAVEGIVCRLAEVRHTGEAYQSELAVAEHHLRDLLDPAAVYISDPDRQDRLTQALRAVRNWGGPEIVGAAAVLARDGGFGRLARAQLITLLGVMATDDAVTVCIGLLDETDPIIRQAVNQSLVFAGPVALEPLRGAMTNPDEHVRSRASEALTLLGDVAVDTAVSALRGTDARQRAAAVRTVGVLGASEAVGAVIARLDDDDPSVRIAAARALGQLSTQDAVTALAQRAADPDPELRATIAKALGAARAPESLSPLLALMDDSDSHVRAAAASALGVLGDERATPALRQHRADPDALARNAAQAALRRLGHSA